MRCSIRLMAGACGALAGLLAPASAEKRVPLLRLPRIEILDNLPKDQLEETWDALKNAEDARKELRADPPSGQ